MQGWTEFARQVIAALGKYDEENKTYYSYYLNHDEDGVKVLSLAMQEADRKNQWEPIPQGKGVKLND